MTNNWDYHYFVRCISLQLEKLLKDTDWKYLLNIQKPPVFMEGQKTFNLYTPGKKIVPFKSYPLANDKVSENLELDRIEEWCGEGHAKEGFYSSASIAELDRPLIKFLENELKAATPPKYLKKRLAIKNGDPMTGENNNSMVLRNEIGSFIEGLNENVKLGFPAFSISDCNTFHTSGYLWGKYAIVNNFKVNTPAPVAVLNFDSHLDCGSGSSKVVRSNGWGAPLIGDKLRECGGCYVSIDASGELLAYRYIENKTVGFKERPKGKPSEISFWEDMKKKWEKAIKYVFISVDRDCLKDHYTQWFAIKPTVTIKTLIATMDTVCTAITNAMGNDVSLIGFDVTGLPESNFMGTGAPLVKVKEWKEEPREEWGNTRDELQQLLSWADGAINPRQPPPLPSRSKRQPPPARQLPPLPSRNKRKPSK